MNNDSITAIVIQILLLVGTLYAANRQYRVSKAQIAAEKAANEKEKAKIAAEQERDREERKAEQERKDETRRVEEESRLQELQRKLQEDIWNRVREERKEMQEQIVTMRASIGLLRKDLEAEREKRATLSVELTATKKQLDITVQALKEAETARRAGDEENVLLRIRVAKLEMKGDTGPLAGVSPDK